MLLENLGFRILCLFYLKESFKINNFAQMLCMNFINKTFVCYVRKQNITKNKKYITISIYYNYNLCCCIKFLNN